MKEQSRKALGVMEMSQKKSWNLDNSPLHSALLQHRKRCTPLVQLIPITICHAISDAPVELQKRFRTLGEGMLIWKI